MNRFSKAEQDWARFRDWNRQVMVEIATIERSSSSPMIDAMIPYRLGWTPKRAALAITGRDGKDLDYLCKIVKGQLLIRCHVCEGYGSVVWRDGVAVTAFDKTAEEREPCPACKGEIRCNDPVPSSVSTPE